MKKENCQLVIIQHRKPKKISRQFLFIVVTCQSVAWNGIYPERWRLFCLALSKSAFLWTSPVFGSCFATSAISFATGWDDLVLVICLFPLFVIILLSCDFCVRVDTVISGNVTSNVFCILYIVSTSIRNGWGHTSWISTVQIQPEPVRPLRPRVMSQEDIPDENANMFCPLGCLTPGHSYAKSDCNGRTVYDCMLVTDGRLMTVHVTGGLLMNVYLWQVDCWWMCTCDRWTVDECVYEYTLAGRLFSLVAASESLVAVLAALLFNTIYPETLHFFPGFSFIMAAAISFVAFFIVV